MSILKRILSDLIIFIFGLEVGCFGIWILFMQALRNPTESNKKYYSRYSDEEL